jgi:hypothetical protein
VAPRLTHALVTVQNGLWTTAVAIVDLSCLVAYQSPLHCASSGQFQDMHIIHTTPAVSFLMPLLYTIVVISSLNARRVEQEDDGGTKGSIESGFATTLVVVSSFVGHSFKVCTKSRYRRLCMRRAG